MADILTDADIAALEGKSVAQVSPELPVLSSQEIARMEQEAAEFDRPIAAGLAGAARGLSLGLSDVAAKKLGYDDELRKLKEYNPISSGIGDVGATIGSAVTGVGLVGLAGKAATRATQKIVANSLAKQVLKSGTAAAIEGGIVGVGQTLSEASLAERDYTPEQIGESLIANVGLGALLGGGLGAAGGAVSRGGGALKSKFFSPKPIETAADDAARAVVGATDDIVPSKPSDFAGRGPLDMAKPNADELAAASRELGLDIENTETLLGQIKGTVASNLQASDSIVAQQFNKNRDKILGKIVEDLDQSLKITQDEQADVIGRQIKKEITEEFRARESGFKSLYASKNLDLKKITAENKELSQTLNAFRQVNPSPTSLTAREIKQTTQLLKTKRLKTLDDIDSHRSSISSRANALMRSGDTQEAINLFKVSDALQRLIDRSIVRAGVKATGGDKALAREFIRQNRALSKDYRVFRQDLSTVAELFKRKVKNPRDFFNALEELPDEQIGKKFLENNLKDYRKIEILKNRFPESAEALRQRYVLDLYKSSVDKSKLDLPKFLDKANKLTPSAREFIFKPEGARTIKNLTTLQKGDQSIVRTQLQQENTVKGLLKGLQNINDLGLVVISKALEAIDSKLTPTKTANKALLIDPSIMGAVKKTTNKIQSGVKKFIRKGAVPGTVKGVLGTPEDNKKKVDEYSLYRDDPETLLAKITQNTQGLNLYSPDTAMAVTNNVIEGANFLASKIPPRDPIDEEMGFSDYEAAVFNRYVKAVENPMSIVDDIESGVLTREGVEAMQTVYPELMTEIRNAALDEMSKGKEKMSFDKKIQLSMLLGYPLSATMKPGFIAAMQAPKQGQQAAPTPQPSASMSTIAGNYETQFQRVTKG